MYAGLLVLSLLGSRSISLSEAEAAARQHAPAVRVAREQHLVAGARQSEALSSLLPSVDATADYQRLTSNFVFRPGQFPNNNAAEPSPSFDTFDFWSTGVQVHQLVWDFGQAWNRYAAARASSNSAGFSALSAERAALLQVRLAFFTALAQRELVEVAAQAVANFDRHVARAREMVKVGVRPPIDLSRAQADKANAQVQSVQAQAALRQAQLQLLAAMGDTGEVEFALGAGELPALPEESASADVLLARAQSERPEVNAAQEEVRAAGHLHSAAGRGYFPSLGVGGTANFAGSALSNLRWNFAGFAFATWNLYEGGAMSARQRAASAELARTEAQLDAVGLQVRTELLEARSQLEAAKQALAATTELVRFAQEQHELAEGRYASGVGNAIEVSDAQLLLTQASAQRVRAEFELSASRARLLAALGGEAP
jgi:outer membrane protein